MGAWNGHGNGHDEDDDDCFTDDPYRLLAPHVGNAFLEETALGKYADLSRDDVHDDDVLWGDRGYFAPPDELEEERSPLDETMWSSGPGSWDPGFGLPVRLRLGHWDVPVHENVPEPAGVPMDVFGPGLSRHTWLWRTAEAELTSFADEPRRIGAYMPILVAQGAEEMLATGPRSLPGLVDEAVGFPLGDTGSVRRYVARELESWLSEADASGGEPLSGPDDDDGDHVARLLARALVRTDFDTVVADVHACAADLLFRNGEAPVELAERVAGILPTLGNVPADSAGPALEAAAELVRDGLVPVGRRPEGRAVSNAAGWLAVGAGLRCAPGAIAMMLCIPSAPRTIIRAQARGFGPFGRYLRGDACEVVATWRQGGTILLAKPGLGKTQLMIWLAACAPGAVVAGTPNVLDISDFAARATDHDVLVFDPANLLGHNVPPGVKVVRLELFSHITDYDSAGVVAAQMVEIAGNHVGARNELFWRTMSAALLRIYLFAAMAAGRPFEDVLKWAEQDEEAELLGILARAGVEAAAEAFAAHVCRASENPRSSIAASALADLQAFANLSTEGEPLDFDRFVAGRGTLVLLADPTTSAACKPAVAFTTRQLIEAQFRLQRRGGAGAPVACFVDEAAYSPGLSPVLAQVLAMGPNRGLNPVAACQSLEQFEGVQGGAREITRAAARTIIFPDSMPPEVRQMATYDDDDFLDLPENGNTHALEGNRLRPMRPYAAHEMGMWRLCYLEAGFSRAGAAPIVLW